jgi:putative copper resistance protein D
MAFRVFILWLHLLGAVVWIGGLCFQLLVVVPIPSHSPVSAERLRLGLSLDIRFRSVMWPAVGLVLLTGLYNVMNVLYATTLAGSSIPPAFARLLGLKLLLVALMLVLQGIQRFALQPRMVALLARLSSEVSQSPDELLRLQSLSNLLCLLTVLAAVVVLLLGLLLHG